MRDAFSRCHPAVNALFFALAIGFSMCLAHPAWLAASLAGALWYHTQLRPRQAGRFFLRVTLPVMLLGALVNPVFSHAGVTVLAYLPSGNPLTLESVLCGLDAGLMLGAVLTWFACCTEVMTSDQYVYLFGRVAPALSLVLSMTLRFVPRFHAQLQRVRAAQRGLAPQAEPDGMLQRLRRGACVLSAVVTWALENAVDTADSMRARGYGLPGRTAFSLWRLDARDRAILLWLGSCGTYLLCGALAGGLYWRCCPTVQAAPVTPRTVSFLLAGLALCLTPAILGEREAGQWKRLHSDA